MRDIGTIAGAVVLLLCLQSCVPAKKLDDANALNSKLMASNEQLKDQANTAVADQESMKKTISDLNEQVKKLSEDTAYYESRYRKIEQLNENINALYEKVIQQSQSNLNSTASEKISLSDSLKREELLLAKREKMLDSLQSNLSDRQEKLDNLRSIIHQKDSASAALKAVISQALNGFEGSDLSVEQQNGQVHVSMAEKLLFKSGSTVVDDQGKMALQQLAGVLIKNPDISIMVEGHTDNVPLNGSGAMKDNWDLSVLRATSIIRLLTQQGVDPKQITAAGRGEYFPVASNGDTEGRAKNRRTEIILSPNLDALMNLISNQ